jgi:tetratricopeptide (TPR) repeat protein
MTRSGISCRRIVNRAIRGAIVFTRRASSRRASGFAVATLVVLVAIGCNPSSLPPPPAASSSDASSESFDAQSVYQLINDGRLNDANEVVRKLLAANPNDPNGLLAAATLAMSQGNQAKAIELFDRIDFEAGAVAMAAQAYASELQLDQSRWFDSIERMERMSKKWPDQVKIESQLSSIYGAMGMAWESRPHLFSLVRSGQSNPEQMVSLLDRGWPTLSIETCEAAMKTFPEDLRPRMGHLTKEALTQNWDVVAKDAVPVIEQHPKFAAANVLYGRALLELNRIDELQRWGAGLAEEVKQHPDYWIIAARAATLGGDPRAAARAYWEACRIDPDSTESHYQLAALLTELQRPQDASRFSQRAQLLTSLTEQTRINISVGGRSGENNFRIAQLLKELGRYWESITWVTAAAGAPEKPAQGTDVFSRDLIRQLEIASPRVLEPFQPALALDLSQYPVPQWVPNREVAPPSATPPPQVASAPITLVDRSSATGLDFLYRPNAGDRPYENWIWQSNGGSVAAIDFDLDGWCDLYFGQAGGEPKDEQGSLPNQLYRNIGGNRWQNVSQQSRTTDRGYAQGVTYGDYNEDGHPDLLVANLGRVHLLRNNGDGTFDDISQSVGLEGSGWSTSIVIADLNGDSINDIYVANYCGSETPLKEPCIAKDGIHRSSCMPTAFPPDPDRVYQGRDDGTFVDMTASWLGNEDGSPGPDGRGLGLLVANLDGNPGLELFVANDMSANQLWMGSGQGASFRLVDQGNVRGLAVDYRGREQACMGVAAADADNDGDIDLVITNFSTESNNFFEQVRPGRFEDRAVAWGIAEPSFEVLGFGTQWADFDLDGRCELFVANGHVNDQSYEGRPYRMAPHLFTNDGTKLSLANAAQVGPYFEGNYLGRAVARIDWDRDLRPDLVVVHLTEPVALLTPSSAPQGRGIAFDLVATQTARDAIGTIVEVKTDQRIHYGQRMTGDGYQSANQQRLFFGLGTASEIESVVVRWPSGQTQTFGPLALDQAHLIIEGRATPVSNR